jgi:hypothetical protein
MPTDPADHPNSDTLDAVLAALADGDHELADAVLDGYEPADDGEGDEPEPAPEK